MKMKSLGTATMLRQRRQASEELKARAELKVREKLKARQTKMEPVARAEPEARQARMVRAEPLRFLILVESRYTLTCRTKTSFCLFNE